MDAKTLTINLLVAYRVLRDSFYLGVAPDSKTELAKFREAMSKELKTPVIFTNAELASILISVGFHFLGRVFPLRMYAPVSDAIRRVRRESWDLERPRIPANARIDASEVCLKIFFFRSIFPKSAIAYPEAILLRHANELAPFGVRAVEPLNALITRLGFFRFQSPDGRYYANMERPEEELVTTTLYLAALDEMRRDWNDVAAPVPFDAILRKVYIPPEIARRALNVEGAPFERRKGDRYVPLDHAGAPARPVENTPLEPRSFEPGPNDERLKTFAAAGLPIQEGVWDSFSTVVYSMFDEMDFPQGQYAPEKNRFYPNRLSAPSIPHDHQLLQEINALPLRFKRVNAEAEEAETVVKDAPVEPFGSAVQSAGGVTNPPEHSDEPNPTSEPEEVEAPTEAPVEASTEEPVETPAEEPVETPIETPVEEPVEAPVEAPIETPVEEPIEAPIAEPIAEPIEAPTETPSEASVEAPIEEPVETPSEAPVEASTEEPTEATSEERDAIEEFEEKRRRSEACEKLGELVDSLFADKHALLFYSQLYARHETLFNDAGVGDVTGVRSALQSARPQYSYDASFVQPTRNGLTDFELVRNQLILRWGDSKRTTLRKLLENVYVPQHRVKPALEYFSNVFNFVSNDDVELQSVGFKRAPEDEVVRSLIDDRRKDKDYLVYYECLYQPASSVLTQYGIDNPAALREAILRHCPEGVRDYGDYAVLIDTQASYDDLVLWTIRSKALEALRDGALKEQSRPQSSFLRSYFSTFSLAFLNRKFLGPAQDVLRVLYEQKEFFKRDALHPGDWIALNLAGEPLTFDDSEEIVNELEDPKSRLNRLLSGESDEPEKEESAPEVETPVLSDADAEPERDAAQEEEPEPIDPALEAVGELVDDLFANNYVLLYYSKLWERKQSVFRDAGVTSALGIRAAIQKVRPQYDAKENYVQSGKETFGVFYEAARRQLELRWGDKKVTTLSELAKDLYIPQHMIKQTLQLNSEFQSTGRDVYAFENFDKVKAQEQEKTAESTTAETTAPDDLSAAPTSSDAPADAAISDQNATQSESPTAFEPEPGSEASEQNEEDSSRRSESVESEATEEPDEDDEDFSSDDEPIETPPQPLTPEERIEAIVAKILESRQTIVYYRALLEGDKALAKEFGDETALRDAIHAKYPGFGYHDTYFEPHRRSARETEDEKIRRSLLLGWGDVDRFKLEKLERKFNIPSTLLERVFRAWPNDFRSEGKQRFSITEKAREEGAKLVEYSDRLLTELQTALSSDDSLLFYNAYFERNVEWLEELGIDSFQLLRREMANLSREHALDYIFFKEFCERKPNGLSYRERIRRTLHKFWGDSSYASVDQLCKRVYVPEADLLETLAVSPDFAFMGANTFQRLRDVDGNPIE